MASSLLSGLTIAILAAPGFEHSEMTQPRQALEAAGAKTVLISPEQRSVKSWKNHTWGEYFEVQQHLAEADANAYDALLLPGGVINPDTLRTTPGAIEFIRAFVVDKKPIAAICHGPWTLINAGAVEGKNVTSWPSLELDLKNAGAYWSDREVVVDENLVTSRNPDDIPAFNTAFINLLANTYKN